MKSPTIRKKFFDFFEKRGHTKIPSSSLIPTDDPTLLFTNAGMNQFKDLFLGKTTRSYNRAISIQKCVRAGGKHNDLDNVGFTKHHLTFFEMMGNFSFGDYFKKEAIEFAWSFLTKEIKLPVEKLHVTVYKTDDEAYNIWLNDIGVKKEKIHRLGEKDNFWQMGDTGPCGPCSEIHIDRGPQFACNNEECGPACDCNRFMEIWNLVFMQYDRQLDGADKPLTQKGIDTGMGLERLCVITQEKDSVFEIDLFEPIIKRIELLTDKKYAKQPESLQAAFHVLADHIRSTSFLIADGCIPSNEGRGYVLRKIIRRAALFSQKLTDKIIFPELSSAVTETMSDIYPELKVHHALIVKTLESEIEKFGSNLLRGQQMLQRYFEKQKDNKQITGEYAFKLYDTYGFPLELITVMANEEGFTVDLKSFEIEMQKQKEQSGKKKTNYLDQIKLDPSIKTVFTGYDELKTTGTIVALIDDKHLVQHIPAGAPCWIIPDQSPLYIFGGGQEADKGLIIIDNQEVPISNIRKINNSIAVHIIAPIDLAIGTALEQIVDKQHRDATVRNHTTAHLLQAALISLFGSSIKQAGSYVGPEYLRYDFTYPEALTAEQIKEVEDLVNKKIRENIPLRFEWTTLEDARSRGIIAFFGDKYNPEKVRIVSVPDFSAELCGGIHVHATGDIGTFKITEVKALSAGHRRIVAVTGQHALNLFQEDFNVVKSLSNTFKVHRTEIFGAVKKLQDEIKIVHDSLKQCKKELLKTNIPQWMEQIETINSIPFLFLHLDDATNEELKEIATTLETKKAGLYFLLSSHNNRTLFLVLCSPEYKSTVNLKNFASWLKESQNLRGGISQNVIQGGGGKFDTKLKEGIIAWVQKERGD